MAPQTLVNSDFENGKNVLKAIDKARLPVTTAFWLYTDESWRLVLATPIVKERGARAAYEEIQQALAGRDDIVPLKQIEVIPVDDPLIRAVNLAVQTPGQTIISPIRFSNNLVGDILIEDAYIYRST